MDALTSLAVVFVLLLYLHSASNGRKLKARIERIRKVRWPDAKIRYMDLRGRRHSWQITIESVRQAGQDWIITAWCHEQKDFLTFHASRIYEYIDLNHIQEVKNVQAYFAERFSGKPVSQNTKFNRKARA